MARWAFRCTQPGVLAATSLLTTTRWQMHPPQPSGKTAPAGLPPANDAHPAETPRPVSTRPAPDGTVSHEEAPCGPSHADDKAFPQRRTQRRAISAVESTAGEAEPAGSTIVAANDERPAPFQAILHDVLPEATEPEPAGAQPAAKSEEPIPGILTIGPRVAPGTAGPNARDAAAAPAPAPSTPMKIRTARAEDPAPAAVPEFAERIDPSFEIRKETGPSPAASDAKQNAAGHAEVAFAARITEQAAASPAPGLSDTQAAIAASRFEIQAADARSNDLDRATPRRSGLPQPNPDSPANSDTGAEAGSPSEMLAQSRLSPESHSRPGAGAAKPEDPMPGILAVGPKVEPETDGPDAKDAAVASRTAPAAKVKIVAPHAADPAPAAMPEFAEQIGSSFEIRNVTGPSPAASSAKQNAAGHAEVAFAARTTEQAAASPAPGLSDAQTAIAASRFEIQAADARSNDPGRATPRRVGLPQPNPNSPANSDTGAEAGSPSEVLAQSRLSPDNSSRPGAGAQGGTRTLAGMPTASRENSDTGGTLPAGEARAATSQNAAPGMPAPPASFRANAGERGGAAGQPASSGRIAQFLEHPNDSALDTSQSVRDISLKLSTKDQASVQIRLSERAGELHVAVRTPDAGLTRGLREGLSDLVGRLEDSGYRTETWQPGGSEGSPSRDSGRESASNGNSPQQQSSSGGQPDARQQRDPQAPQWASELESTLQRSNSPWPPLAT